jgi:hypothetical protein
MKKICFCLLIFNYASAFSQNTIKFAYDKAGNITQRYIQVTTLRLPDTAPKDSVLTFKIYPNPTSDQIFIDGPLKDNVKEAEVLLYNISGSVLKQDVYYGTKKAYQLKGLTTGIYFLEIKYSKKESSTYRILITE